MKKASYYWDINESLLLPKNGDRILIDYFHTLRNEAQKIIRRISKENLIPAISRLNVIDEKLILFFFYQEQQLKGMTQFEDPNQIIALVENDYQDAFFDVLHPVFCEEVRQRSLIWKLEGSNDYSGTLWDVDFFLTIIKKQENQIKRRKEFLFIQSYYDYLAAEATQLCEKLSARTFNAIFPLLLSINCILQVLLEGLTRNQEYIGIYLTSQGLFKHDITYLGREQFDFSFGKFSEQSMRRQFFWEEKFSSIDQVK